MTIELIKQIRRETGAGVVQIKRALDETGGDVKKAKQLLRQHALKTAVKKSARATSAGWVEAYNHQGRIGVLVQVNCETDFVARNLEFRSFVHDLALQIASMNPASVLGLHKQPFIKDESQTIEEVLKSLIGKIGENIVIKRFTRYELGQ